MIHVRGDIILSVISVDCKGIMYMFYVAYICLLHTVDKARLNIPRTKLLIRLFASTFTSVVIFCDRPLPILFFLHDILTLALEWL